MASLQVVSHWFESSIAHYHKFIMNNFTAIPAFASYIFCLDVKENFSRIVNLQNEIEYWEILQPGEAKSAGSTTQYILDDFIREKNILMKYFNELKNNVLEYNSTDFKMTTSWITKTNPGGYSKSHNHGNSFMSGVFYYDDYDDASSAILFEPQNFPKNTFQILADNTNNYNCTNIQIFPQKNLLILFPSYLYHKITYNNSDKARYSLAFNISPVGKIGCDDSCIVL